MYRPFFPWLVFPMLLLCASCPAAGGDGGFGIPRNDLESLCHQQRVRRCVRLYDERIDRHPRLAVCRRNGSERNPVVSPNAAFLYVANGANNDVIGFAINSSTGALTAMSGSPFAAGSIPIGVTLDSTGRFCSE